MRLSSNPSLVQVCGHTTLVQRFKGCAAAVSMSIGVGAFVPAVRHSKALKALTRRCCFMNQCYIDRATSFPECSQLLLKQEALGSRADQSYSIVWFIRQSMTPFVWDGLT
jgi:hypothetical protein